MKYLINHTFKFFMLIKILNKIVIQKKFCLLIFAAYSTSQFQTKAFIKTLKFKILMLRVSMSTQKRSAVKTEFADSENDVKILLVTYSICLLELNLHHMCHAIVILEPALNMNTIIQMIEQVHHLNQKYHQNI